MHCINDSCETNGSRCSWHWPGALSAHTVSISSIIAHLSSSDTRSSPLANPACSTSKQSTSSRADPACASNHPAARV